MNVGKNALPAATVSMSRSRISFTRRSCSVPFARSTRPLACEELAQMMSAWCELRDVSGGRRVDVVSLGDVAAAKAAGELHAVRLCRQEREERGPVSVA